MRNTPDRRHADLQTCRHARPGPDAPATAAAPAPVDHNQSSEWSLLLGQVHHVDQRWLRQVNRALVLSCVREHGPISRVKIAERTALSRATVSAITNALLREGVIREGERLPSTTRGGRRAVLLHAMTYRDGTSDTQASGQ